MLENKVAALAAFAVAWVGAGCVGPECDGIYDCPAGQACSADARCVEAPALRGAAGRVPVFTNSDGGDAFDDDLDMSSFGVTLTEPTFTGTIGARSFDGARSWVSLSTSWLEIGAGPENDYGFTMLQTLDTGPLVALLTTPGSGMAPPADVSTIACTPDVDQPAGEVSIDVSEPDADGKMEVVIRVQGPGVDVEARVTAEPVIFE